MRKKFIIVLLAVIATGCTGTAVFFTQKNHQEIQIRFENADGSYGEYQTVYSGNPRWGKKISYSWPGNQIYESCNISFKSKGSQIHRHDIKRKTCSVSVSSDDASFNISTLSASRTQVRNALIRCRIGEKYSISGITPRNGYHYVGMTSNGSAALNGKAEKDINIRLDCKKDAIKNAVSFVSDDTTATTDTFYAQPGKIYNLNELIEAPEGYTLGTKYKINNGKEKSMSESFTQEDTPMTFTVDCTKIEYDITYNGIDENVKNPNPSKFSAPFNLQDPVKEGYTFEGWYINEERVTSVTKLENTTLTAKWKKDETDETDDENNETDDENNAENSSDTNESSEEDGETDHDENAEENQETDQNNVAENNEENNSTNSNEGNNGYSGSNAYQDSTDSQNSNVSPDQQTVN